MQNIHNKCEVGHSKTQLKSYELWDHLADDQEFLIHS